MACLVPSPDAEDHSVEVEADPDQAEEADDGVADEKHVVRSLSFVAALERGIDHDVHSNGDEDVRSPEHELVEEETDPVPAGRALGVKRDVEVADSGDGLGDGECEEGVEGLIEVAAAVGEV